jgi:hypothetical protein
MAPPTGRPKTFRSRRRFLVSLDAAEYRRLQATCRRFGLNASEFVRDATLTALRSYETIAAREPAHDFSNYGRNQRLLKQYDLERKRRKP